MRSNNTPRLSYESQGWLQYRLELSREKIRGLCKVLNYPVLLDGDDLDSHSRAYQQNMLIFSAEPNRVFSARDYRLEELDETMLALQQALPLDLESTPFVCGHIGYLGYDQHCRDQKSRSPGEAHPPQLEHFQIHYYAWSYVFDFKSGEGVLTFSPATPRKTINKILDLIKANAPDQALNPNTRHDAMANRWQKSSNFDHYQHAFEKAHEYILAGDVYQINLTQRFESPFKGDVVDYYFSKKRDIHAPYCAYFDLGDQRQILSFSPEQFIECEGSSIRSKPIKGTIANDDTDAAEALRSSLKDQAENLMIVDLLRNDLSKVCTLHSVEVPKLFEAEFHGDIIHLVSTITGQLKAETSPFAAFIACFPGGSITGAPKIRAMEIIKELEAFPRSAYCGSLFYWSDHGNFDSNILIRSIVHDQDTLYCWAGGGIVADSDCDSEYQESLLKVRHITGLKS